MTCALALVWGLVVLTWGDAPDGTNQAVFREAVRPTLTASCLGCHDAAHRKGGLDLSTRAAALKGGESGPAIVPGQPDESLILEKLAEGAMPPNRPLPPEQVEAFRKWVVGGASYEGEPLSSARAGLDWWSLQPIRSVEPPTVHASSWPRNPIDRFILAALEARGLSLAPEADRLTLIRRLSLDLTGLPPTPEQVRAFVDDARPDAYERLVDRLLADPAYGERWGRHWLDVVRFAESHGYETNELRQDAWPYRDYVIRALNRDTPLPRFVLEQIVGDQLKDADALTQGATGFLVGGTHDIAGNATPEGMAQQRMDDLDDIVHTVGTAFLGLSVGCARCHDHKFDPIPQRDYYALVATLAGVKHASREVRRDDADRLTAQAESVRRKLERVDGLLDATEPPASPSSSAGGRRPMVNYRRNVERLDPPAEGVRRLRFIVEETDGGLEPCLDELEVYAPAVGRSSSWNLARVQAGATVGASSTYPHSPAIHALPHVRDGRYGNSRSWISNERGKGWVELRWFEPVTIERIVWGRDREGAYQDRLAVRYRIEVSDETDSESWRTVVDSSDRLSFRMGIAAKGGESGRMGDGPERPALARWRKDLDKALETLSPTFKVYAGTFETPGPTHVRVRGDATRLGDVVQPSTLSAVRPAPEMSEGELTDPERRRALALQIGHPENPLTARVWVNRAWHYHFGTGIVATPSDFGFQGGAPSHPELLDWLATHFRTEGWRLKPIHRLIVTSATYRQSSRPNARAQAIDVGNRLLWRWAPRRIEAEAIRDSVLAVAGTLDRRMGGPGYSIWERNTNYVVVFRPLDEPGPETYRRMVYQFRPRSQHDPTFGAFDCPDAALVAPRRTISNTPLQALNLLNSPFLVTQAGHFAERVVREAGSDLSEQVRRAVLLAFGRSASEAEVERGTELVRAYGLAALTRALLNANEFVTLP